MTSDTRSMRGEHICPRTHQVILFPGYVLKFPSGGKFPLRHKASIDVDGHKRTSEDCFEEVLIVSTGIHLTQNTSLKGFLERRYVT